ncbi:uncharacterized protein LOC143294155 [Babylonia areolata]|uniref:uncharacterized protein LOC143294155 n=1 Tax=Babylonia areolata TaxID=304850 RepID=UPI003FCF8677
MAERRQDRISRWRSFAAELEVPREQVAEFVASQMLKEDEAAEKRELEERAHQRQLEWEEEQRRKRFEWGEEQRRKQLEWEEEQHQQQREEHSLRLEVLQREKKGKNYGNSMVMDQVEGESDTDDDRGFRPSLPKFDDSKGDISSWLKRFERVATLYGWKKSTWATRVSTRLTGKAEDVYNNLSDADAGDYDKLKEQLLARYQLNAETYRRFRNCKRKDNETFVQFSARLQDNLKQWHEQSKIPDLKQLILLEQFLQSLQADMAAYVMEKQPQSLEEAVSSAEVYFMAHRGGRKFLQPVGLSGNASAGQDKSKVGGTKSESGNSSVKTCFICQSPKHLARDCPRKGKSAGAVQHQGTEVRQTVQVPTLCTPCREQEYDPHCLVVVEGKAVPGLRDTGSHVCVVKKSLISDCHLTGRQLEVSMAEKDIKRHYPIAVVRIESPFFTGQVEAVVMETPVVDFIVGNHARLEDRKVLPVYGTPKEISVVTRAQAAEKKQPSTLRVASPGLETVTPEQLKELQKGDPGLKSLREAADRRDVRVSGRTGEVSFRWRKGILYREYRQAKTEYSQVVVPAQLRHGVMKLAHEPPMGGHQGGKKTLDRIWKQFFWPGMCADVRRFVSSCDQCQKVSPKPQRVPLGKMPLIDTPFERVAVDLVGPITPASGSGNRYILVVVDYATRYPEAVPLKTVEATTVAEALWEVWTRVGVPSEILTDRGTQFMSDVMKQMERLLSIRGLATTPYHAQGNGLVERYNGVLKTALRKLTQEKPKQWDRYIPALLFAYREATQESLGFSPFELLYGRTVRGPLSVLRQLWTDEHTSEEVRTTAEYVVDLRNRIEETCELARRNLAAACQRHAEVFNRKSQNRVFSPGDKVLLLLPQRHNKLQLCWQGPFEVLERKGEADYKIRMGGQDKLYHANLLKRYVERQADSAYGEVPMVAVAVIEETEPTSVADRELPVPSLVAEETIADLNFGPGLNDKQKEEVLTIARRHEKVITDVPLKTNLAEFDMTVDTAKPVRVKQYPLPHAKVEIVKQEVETMKTLGVIEPAASPYNAPVVLVRKKDGKIRFCVDYRRLNNVTVFDAEPLPDVEHLFSSLGKARYFSKWDLSKGYWQIPVREDIRPMTAFTTPSGQFQFTVMPFGLKNAAAVFSRMMRALLDPIGMKDVHNFMDDIMIASETWEEHLSAIEAIFQRLEEANLSVRPKKCYIGFEELSFLGHVVRHGQILPEMDKVEKVMKAPVPETKTQVRAFLGLVGNYRKFIPNFSAIALPLTDLTRKGAPNNVVWTPECDRTFKTLKGRLVSRPVLQLPDLSCQFVLRTDASDRGLGAVLLQEKEGVLHPVAFASRKLSGTESHYSTIEKECLAVVWATDKFQQFLYGQQFVLETDHQPLRRSDDIGAHAPRPADRCRFGSLFNGSSACRGGHLAGTAV